MFSNPLATWSCFNGWSRRGKVLFSLMVGALCVEGALAFQTVAYPINPCKIEDAFKFITAEGGCKDVNTGRVWSRNTISEERGGTWHYFSTAKTYCSNLVEGGYDDWRLPTRTELKTVSANGAGTYLDVFWVNGRNNNGVPYEYDFQKWSSTTIKYKGALRAYVVALGSGEEQYQGWSTTQSWTDVVCVR